MKTVLVSVFEAACLKASYKKEETILLRTLEQRTLAPSLVIEAAY